jgi:hypothetical protein
VKLFRILDSRGRVIETRDSNGLYHKRSSATRAIAQLKSRYWLKDEEFTIEETEVSWVVSN